MRRPRATRWPSCHVATARSRCPDSVPTRTCPPYARCRASNSTTPRALASAMSSVWPSMREVLARTLVDAPTLIARKTDGHSRELEPASHMPRERFDGSRRFGCEEHVASQIEQSRHFVAASDGLARTRLNRCRQVARDHGHNEKRKECNPVLRVSDRQCAERRQEKEVERERGRDRRDRGNPQTPERCDPQHDEEKRQRNRGRADLREGFAIRRRRPRS